MLLAPTLVVWAGVRQWNSNPVLGSVLIAFGTVTLLLAFRAARQAVSPGGEFHANGGLARPTEDYLIWMAIGVPFLVVGAMFLVLLIGGPDALR
jgi:hypothetical protein